MDPLADIDAGLDPSVSKDANLQHLRHMFEGYRAHVLGQADCPYASGSAREHSWYLGQVMAARDAATPG